MLADLSVHGNAGQQSAFYPASKKGCRKALQVFRGKSSQKDKTKQLQGWLLPDRNTGVKALHPRGVWSLPCGCLGGEQSMCRITDMKYSITWKGLRIYPASGGSSLLMLLYF